MANTDATPTPAPAQTQPPKDEYAGKQVQVLVNRESSVQIPTVREKDGSVNPDSIIFLAPGWNLVDAKKWAAAKQNHGVRMLLQTKIPPATAPEENPEKVGHMVLVEGKTVDMDNPLAPLPEDKALQFVAETFQVPLLKRLLEQEQRAPVLRALRAQVEKIEGAKQQAKVAKAKA